MVFTAYLAPTFQEERRFSLIRRLKAGFIAPGLSALCIFLLCFALLLFSPARHTVAQTSDKRGDPPPALVEVQAIEEKTVAPRVSLLGTGEAWLETVVASEEAGLVSGMLVEEGRYVKKNQPLCRQESTQLELKIEAAEADLAEAKVLQLQNRREWERQKRLYQINSIAEKAYEDAKFKAEAADKRVERLDAGLRGLKDQMKSKTTRAPISGYVVQRHCLLGQWLGEGEPVVTLVVPDPILFIVPVPERHIPHIQKGDQIPVTFDALPDRIFKGVVDAVILRADQGARTFPVRIKIANAKGAIKPGMLGRATLPAGRARKALLVPKDALILDPSGAAVYTVSEGVARFVPVKTGSEQGALIEVEGSLKAGAVVVIRGNERLRPGQPVQIRYEVQK